MFVRSRKGMQAGSGDAETVGERMWDGHSKQEKNDRPIAYGKGSVVPEANRRLRGRRRTGPFR